MNIAELKEAVDKSDMDTEAKAELNTILKLYVDVLGLISNGDYGD